MGVPTCECGTCKKCKKRAYMRDYYHRDIVKSRKASRMSYYTSGACGGIVVVACAWCERPMETTGRQLGRAGLRYCSRSCKAAARNATLSYKRKCAKPVRTCRHCCAEMPRSMRADAAYCSAECNSRAHLQTRKASEKLDAKQKRIDRAYIIERDGGRCHLCNRKVPEKLLTLDHLIPLSKGGTHTAENLRVACWPCNARKGARAANDQLLLIG